MTGLGRTPYDEGLAWTWRSDCPSKVSRAKSKSRGVVCVSVVKRKTATARRSLRPRSQVSSAPFPREAAALHGTAAALAYKQAHPDSPVHPWLHRRHPLMRGISLRHHPGTKTMSLSLRSIAERWLPKRQPEQMLARYPCGSFLST